MYLMMDIEISSKGHCESFSHFLDLVSYTVIVIPNHDKLHTALIV